MFGRGGRGRKATDQVGRALDLLQQRALYADKVDWAETRAAVLATAEDPEQLELQLFQLARTVGGRRSGVRRAGFVRTELEPPTVEEQGDALVITLPACGEQHVRGYVEAARAALTGRTSARWIVDLRGNGGGSIWGLLGAVAPLLGEGEIGAFVDRDGGRTPWTVREGVVSAGGAAQAQGLPERFVGPVSVLTDGHTASSAEAVAVAFRGMPGVRSYGAPTLGLTTASESVPLPGDLVLTVTTSHFADRTGTLYDGPITPDVPSEDPLSMALWDL